MCVVRRPKIAPLWCAPVVRCSECHDTIGGECATPVTLVQRSPQDPFRDKPNTSEHRSNTASPEKVRGVFLAGFASSPHSPGPVTALRDQDAYGSSAPA